MLYQSHRPGQVHLMHQGVPNHQSMALIFCYNCLLILLCINMYLFTTYLIALSTRISIKQLFSEFYDVDHQMLTFFSTHFCDIGNLLLCVDMFVPVLQ